VNLDEIEATLRSISTARFRYPVRFSACVLDDVMVFPTIVPGARHALWCTIAAPNRDCPSDEIEVTLLGLIRPEWGPRELLEMCRSMLASLAVHEVDESFDAGGRLLDDAHLRETGLIACSRCRRLVWMRRGLRIDDSVCDECRGSREATKALEEVA